MGLSTTDPGATLVVAEAVPVNADAADAPIAVAVAAQPAVAPTPQFMEDELQALTREMRKRCGSTYEGTGWLYCFKIRDRLDLLPFSNGRGENGEFPRQSDMQVSLRLHSTHEYSEHGCVQRRRHDWQLCCQ